MPPDSGRSPRQHRLDPTSDQILFQVHRHARAQAGECGVGQGVRDDRDRAACAAAVPGGQADAVDGERALLDHFHAAVVRQHDGEAFAGALGPAFDQAADAIDVATDQMAAQALAEGECAFEVYAMTDGPAADRGLASGLGADVEAGDAAGKRGHGQAGA